MSNQLDGTSPRVYPPFEPTWWIRVSNRAESRESNIPAGRPHGLRPAEIATRAQGPLVPLLTIHSAPPLSLIFAPSSLGHGLNGVGWKCFLAAEGPG